jgi:hypothetical protein
MIENNKKNNITMNQSDIQNYTSPEVEIMDFQLELFTGSVLGGSMGIDGWDNTDFPDTTL